MTDHWLSVPRSSCGRNIRPDFHILKIDQSDGWCETILKIAGRVLGVYVYDASKHVHCCELAPSYELYWLEDQPEKAPDDDDEREEFVDQIIEAGMHTPEVMYMHVSHVDNAERYPLVDKSAGWPETGKPCRIHLGDLWPEDDDVWPKNDAEENEWMDAILEDLRGNPL